MRGTALFLVMLLVPAGAIAQEATRSFAALNREGVLAAGEEILITCDLGGTGDYREMEVEVVGLTDSSITVEVRSLPSGRWDDGQLTRTGSGGYHVEIPENQVSQIAMPSHGMRRLTAGLIGFGAGLGASIAVTLACWEDCPISEEGTAALWILPAAGGAAAGALLASPTPEQTVYMSSGLAQSSFTYSLSPIVSNKRKGALFTITW